MWESMKIKKKKIFFWDEANYKASLALTLVNDAPTAMEVYQYRKQFINSLHFTLLFIKIQNK